MRVVLLPLFTFAAALAAAQQPSPVPQQPPIPGEQGPPSTFPQPLPTMPKAAQPPPLVWPPRIGIFGQTLVSLQDVIAGVLANNNDIEAARLGQQTSRYQLVTARGVFDPVIGAAGNWENQVSPVSSLISGSGTGEVTQRVWTATPQLTQLTPCFGTSYSLNFASTRLSTDNQFPTINPQFPSAVTFTFTQPLARNLLIDLGRHDVFVARRNIALTDEQFRQRVIESVTQAVEAYWNLALAYENLRVQREAVELARQQLEANRRMVEKGVLAPIDIVQAETQVALFQQSAYAAEDTLTRAENLLKTLMLPRTSPQWTTALIPATPMNPEVPLITLDDAIREAMTGRPELNLNDISAQIAKINTRFFRDQTKPQVDAFATFVSAGLAGTPVPPRPNALTTNAAIVARVNELSVAAGLPELPPSPGAGAVVPPTLVGGYGQSLSNLARFNFPTMIAGLRFSFPIFNRTAEGNLGASLVQERVIENQREGLVKAIEADVRNWLQAVQADGGRLEAARVATRSAQQQYDAEVRRFQAGVSTVFLVLQRQTTLVTTRTQLLQAEADLSNAIAELQRATARTLGVYNISLRRP